METLITRLKILHDGQVISQDVFDNSILFVERLSKKKTNNSDAVAMLITHIAMALQRLHNNELVMAMDEEIKEEIDLHSNIQGALDFWNENLDIFSELPENEKYYILANFCNIL